MSDTRLGQKKNTISTPPSKHCFSKTSAIPPEIVISLKSKKYPLSTIYFDTIYFDIMTVISYENFT